MIIKIGTNKYKVEEVNEIGNKFINLFRASEALGEIHFPSCTKSRTVKKILIKRDRDKAEKQMTLFHEIAHGLCYELAKRYTEFYDLNDNEKFIDYFASKLMTCFKIKEYGNKRRNTTNK
jgi:hypothetical protein